MVPAAQVEEVVRACVGRGVPLVSIYSDGFAESGASGAARQQAIVDIARAGGTRVIGPNSIGIIVPPQGLALSVNAVLDMPRITPGRLGLVSQSGSLIGAILSRGEARGIGFSALVSIGNEGDLSVGDVTDLLVDDAHTDAILLFLETVRDAPVLARACCRAYHAGKPVTAYVLGQSALGRELAATHTGALAGNAEALAAWLDAQGVVRVDQFETLLEIGPLLRQGRPPAGRRVAVLTTTGGGAAMVVDRIGSEALQVVPPPASVIASLAARGIDIGDGPVTDLTLAGTRREVYSAVLDAYLASDHCDTVLAVAGSSAQFHPQHVVEPIVAAARGRKHLLAFAAPQADAALALFARSGLPAFRTPEACADALRSLARWRAPEPDVALDADERAAVAAAAMCVAGGETGPQDEAQARAVFAALGINQASGAPSPVARWKRRCRCPRR
jgi:acyl-CoA synthetase (NDP forming)